jgi:hypothetical protein
MITLPPLRNTGEIILAISRIDRATTILETEEAHQPGNAGIDGDWSVHGGYPFRTYSPIPGTHSGLSKSC